MNSIVIILGLILLGAVLLIIELAVIPGVTVFGIAGGGLFVYSTYLAFVNYGIWGGVLALLLVTIVTPIIFYRFFKGRLGKKMRLSSAITGKAAQIDKQAVKQGDRGVALTRLAPIGKILVDNNVYEGKTSGNLIDAGERVKVIKVLKNQLVIKQIKSR